MNNHRLSPLDAAFLQMESASSPMHVGWAAVFSVPADGARPTFEQIRAHIESRLDRAPRYRQRLVHVPLGLGEPVWADDETFDVARHVRQAGGSDLGRLADEVMSQPLASDRPLWELWIAECLDDGTLGVVGKAHHCLVDGLAAVELMALLLDPTPEPERGDAEQWRPDAAPSLVGLVRDAVGDRIGRSVQLARAPADLLGRPRRLLELPARAVGLARTAVHTTTPLAPATRLNGAMNSARHLAWCSRPLEELKVIKRSFGTTVNDVVLAAAAGALRALLIERGEPTDGLRAMVPVSVRADEETWGNRIAFLYVALPCDEADAVARLSSVNECMGSRKRSGEAQDADVVLRGLGRAPGPVRNLATRALAGPRLSNLTISNIPGPDAPLYLMGCKAERAFPIVPLTAGHGLSIGMTSIDGQACFGIYAQAGLSVDAERIAQGIEDTLDELLTRAADHRAGAARAPAANGRTATPVVREPTPAPVALPCSSGPLLLTGATGFLGMELLARYLQRTDRTVYALIRADDDAHAERRLDETLTQLFGDAAPYRDRVVAVTGDVTERGLGIAEPEADRLASAVDEVVHAAASVSFDLELEETRRINLDGTRRLLRFAERCRRQGGLRRFSYISTAYVAGDHDGCFAEDDLDVGQGFRNSYEQSKYETEQLIAEYRGQLPITVVRPSIIVGDRHSGWTASFNVLYWPLRAFSRGSYPALPARSDAPLDVVSVDYVADAILALADDPDAAGCTYHLTASEHATSVGELLGLAARRFDRVAPPLIAPELYRHVLAPVLMRIKPSARRFLRATESYLPYFGMRVVYDNRRATAALAPHGIRPAPMPKYFEALMDYAQSTHWGRRPLTRAAAQIDSAR